MEDRYLFKAKRLDWREFPEKEQWIIGYYVLGFDVYEQPVHLIFEPTSMFFSHGETDGWTEIDSSTLCQCTGLKDKNGKRIWENDIVRDKHGNFYKAFWQNNYYQFSWICIKSAKLPIGAKWSLWNIKSFEIEVVGNIFDNPELLESEGQYDRE